MAIIPNPEWLQEFLQPQARPVPAVDDPGAEFVFLMSFEEETGCRSICVNETCSSFNCAEFWRRVGQYKMTGLMEQPSPELLAAFASRKKQTPARRASANQFAVPRMPQNDQYDRCRCGKRKKAQYATCYTCRFGDG